MNPSFVHNGIWRFPRLLPSPTSVGFSAHAADGLRVAYRPCSPKTSLVAYATNWFTHGRVGFSCEIFSLNRREANFFPRSFRLKFGDKIRGGCVFGTPRYKIVAQKEFQLQSAYAGGRRSAFGRCKCNRRDGGIARPDFRRWVKIFLHCPAIGILNMHLRV